MIRRLVLVQHLSVTVLVVVGVGRGLGIGDAAGPLLGSTGLFLAWYAVGARRAASRLDASAEQQGRLGQGLGVGGWWFLGLVAVWVLTVTTSAEMVWVAFALWLLAGHLLPLAPGVAVSVLVLALVVGRGGHAEGWSTAAVLGPVIGAVFAVALSRGLQLIVRDSLERERLVTSLVAAQEEAEELQAELAQIQHAAGVLSERTRLSRDIHDTLAQGFSSILLLARAGTATDDPAARARLLRQIESSAAEHLQEARHVVGALAPAPLESGLIQALRRITARLEQETGVHAEVRADGDVTSLPPPVEVALLRTAQSALANVRQHAQAASVVLTLAGTEDSVRLDVVDDGRGFDLATLGAARGDAARGGYGLRATRERLQELGGGLDIESEPGVGTALSAHLPRRTAEGWR